MRLKRQNLDWLENFKNFNKTYGDITLRVADNKSFSFRTSKLQLFCVSDLFSNIILDGNDEYEIILESASSVTVANFLHLISTGEIKLLYQTDVQKIKDLAAVIGFPFELTESVEPFVPGTEFGVPTTAVPETVPDVKVKVEVTETELGYDDNINDDDFELDPYANIKEEHYLADLANSIVQDGDFPMKEIKKKKKKRKSKTDANNVKQNKTLSVRVIKTSKDLKDDNYWCYPESGAVDESNPNNENGTEINADGRIIKKRPRSNILWSCEFCKETFRREYSFAAHLVEHIGKEALECKVCKRFMKSAKHWEYHKYYLHKQYKPVVCSFCGKSYSKLGINAHIRNAHTSDKMHECETCGYKTKTRGNLLSHMVTHETEPRHICHLCGKKFKRLDALEFHQIKHGEKGKHQCHICKAYKPSASDLKHHIKMHEGTAHMACKQCGKILENRYALNRHKKLCGRDPVRVKCKECNHECLQSQFRKHVLVNHCGTNAYVCPFCNERFRHSTSMYRHRKAVHPGMKADDDNSVTVFDREYVAQLVKDLQIILKADILENVHSLPLDQRTVNPLPLDQKPVNSLPHDQRTVNPLPLDQKPVNPLPIDQRTVNPLPHDQRTVNPLPLDQKPVNPLPIDQRTVNPLPLDQRNVSS